MLSPDARLEPNTIEIAAKVLDGEAILINLSTGTYYSMDKVGTTVWVLINEGYSVAEIAKTLTTCYDADAAQVQNDLEQVLGALILERIVTPVMSSSVEKRGLPPCPGAKEPYEPPKLNIYQDMGDLLALDPPMPGLADLSEFKEEK
jgi:hypothetical protein